MFMSEIKKQSYKKTYFLFLSCFKIAVLQFIAMYQPSRQGHNFFLAFCVKFGASNVFTGYDIGCLRSLQLKKCSKLHLHKQISRNLLRKNAYL